MTYRVDAQGRKRVTVIDGDGIGPEVVAAARRVLDEAGAPIAWEPHEAGLRSFARGNATGVAPETLASIAETRVVLKGPLETPVGHGEKSANVTLRKLFETFANVRPVRELAGVPTRFSGAGVDLVIVRENVEDLYAGIEHLQTPGVAQCLKLMSRKGCEKVVRLAFELAVAEGRRRVHCATKANIMKLTEGLMKRTFEEVAREYPGIEAQHILVDNCAHQLVRNPEQFEVIVTSNMNGDILSDLTSGLIGGLGFAPGANLGHGVAVFEAVHGSAPTIAGQDVANPTAVLLSAVLLLRHLDEVAVADRVEHAVYAALEDGVHTQDVRREGSVGTRAFADAVCARLGRRAERTPVRSAGPLRVPERLARVEGVAVEHRVTHGFDLFVESSLAPDALGRLLGSIVEATPVRLKMISNRGTRVFPLTGTPTDCVDHWRCRFVARRDEPVSDETVLSTMAAVAYRGLRWMHVEKLEVFDGARGYTLAQGEE